MSSTASAARIAADTARRAESSVARVEANRRNGLKSTGPRTPEGKARVSENAREHRADAVKPRRSSVVRDQEQRHGLRSQLNLSTDTALPFEREEFLATLESFMADLAPHGPLETRLVERLAQIDLRLNRAVRMETTHLEMNTRIVTKSMAGALPPDEQTQQAWLTTLAFLNNPNATTLIAQYESRLARDFARTLTQLRQAQKLRVQNDAQELSNQTQSENCQSAASNRGVQSQDAQNVTTPAEQTQLPPNPSQESAEQTHKSVETNVNPAIQPPPPDQRSSALISGQHILTPTSEHPNASAHND
jgi:hypothetical protein